MFRVTESEGAATKECVEHMVQKTTKFWTDNGKCKVHVHISPPCTGGCPWNNVNKDLPGGKERIQQHQKKFSTLLTNVDKFLASISDVSPSISFELPSFCEYWKWKSVKRFKQKYGLVGYKLHGCSGWCDIRTRDTHQEGLDDFVDCRGVCAALEQLRCDGQHEHAQPRGKALREAEGYTFRLIDRIHVMFRNLSQHAVKPTCALRFRLFMLHAPPLSTHTHTMDMRTDLTAAPHAGLGFHFLREQVRKPTIERTTR